MLLTLINSVIQYFLLQIHPLFIFLLPLISPLFSGALYLAAAAGDCGDSPLGKHLLRVFSKPHLLRLLLTGLFGATILIGIHALLGAIGIFVGVNDPLSHSTIKHVVFFASHYPVISFVTLGLGGIVCFYLATIYALIPALIVFHYLPLSSAISLAFLTGLRNWRPVLYYLLLVSIVLILSLLPLLFGLPGLVVIIMIWMVLSALFTITNFYIWKSLFTTSELK